MIAAASEMIFIRIDFILLSGESGPMLQSGTGRSPSPGRRPTG